MLLLTCCALAIVRRGTNVSWTYFTPASSVGFSQLALLDLSRNALNSSLPTTLVQLPLAASLGVSVFDNQLVGTIPPSYTALSWMTLSYNPGLVGTLPSGFAPSSTVTKLRAWSGYNGLYYTAAQALSSASLGAAPTYGSGILFGTSIGLNRPLASILTDVKAGLDPTGVLTSWNSSLTQPCPPWLSGNTNPGQSATSPGYGRSWTGVTCGEWDGAVSTSTPNLGGARTLTLNGLGLRGTLPVSLASLASLTLLDVSRNALSGSLPIELTQLPQNASMGVSLFDNGFNGTVPTAYTAFAWVTLSYNPQLVGALPSGFAPSSTVTKLRAWSGYNNAYYTAAQVANGGANGYAPTYGSGILFGTSIGLDRPLASILMDVKAGLDPTGVLTSWNSSLMQPCPPWLSGNSNPSQQVSLPGYGRAWTGVTCSDWDGAVVTSTSNLGGVGSLAVSGLNFQGTLPDVLRELRSLSQLSLPLNRLSGSIPTAWCVVGHKRVRDCAEGPQFSCCC